MSEPQQVSVGSNRRHGNVAAWSRVVLVLAISGLALFPVLAVLAMLTFAGGRLGWVPSLLAFGGLGFISGWLAVPSRWRAARVRTSVGLAIVGGILGLAVAHLAPPTYGRLRDEIEVFEPPGWRLRSETTEGSALCFDYCRAVTRTYDVEASPTDVVEELRPGLASRGLRPSAPADQEPMVFDDAGRGDIAVRVEVAGEDELTTVRITATAD